MGKDRKKYTAQVKDNHDVGRGQHQHIEFDFDATTKVVLIFDPNDFNIIDVNPTASDFYGWTYGELTSKKLTDLIILNTEEIEHELRKIFRQGKNCFKFRQLLADTSVRDVEMFIVPTEKNGQRLFYSLVNDITEQKKKENDLRLFRMLIDGTNDAIEVLDPETGRFLDVNDKGCKDLGYTRDEFLKLSVFDIDPLVDRDLFHGIVNGISETGSKMWEGVHLRKDGSTFPVEVNIKMVNLDREYIITVVRDITYRKKAEEQIQILTKSVEQSPSSIVITDVKGTIEYVNPRFLEITGYTKEEVIGKHTRFQKSGKISKAVYKELWETIKSGNIWRGEIINKKKNGDLYWEWVTITSIKDEDGSITNYIAIREDISAIKELESELISAKEKAEESDRLKSAFLSNISHEIRTPLNSIIGFSELLTDDYFSIKEKKDFIGNIIDNGNSLLNIISDIVDLSQMESGLIPLRISCFSVKSFLSELGQKPVFNLQGKGIKLIINIENKNGDCDPLVLADYERLDQVFNNLIDNAIKFTHRGQIEVGYTNIKGMVEFYVEDTGIGISRDFHEVIFEHFRQVETTNTRKYGGNGLGLAITKKLVELMGGKIWLESEPGRGTIFFFTIPVSK